MPCAFCKVNSVSSIGGFSVVLKYNEYSKKLWDFDCMFVSVRCLDVGSLYDYASEVSE